jgi:hydrogenase/urease accessory protein HupE
MVKTFVGVILLGTVMSFHDTLWPWSIVPLVIAASMLALGLDMERKNKS